MNFNSVSMGLVDDIIGNCDVVRFSDIKSPCGCLME